MGEIGIKQLLAGVQAPGFSGETAMLARLLSAALAAAGILLNPLGGGALACDVLIGAASPAALTFVVPPPPPAPPLRVTKRLVVSGRAGKIKPPTAVSIPNPQSTRPASIDYRPYMKNLEKDIRSAWKKPQVKDFLPVVTTFQIRRNGDIRSIRISKSSGNKIVDDAALKALSLVNPARPLPVGAPEYANVRFVFENEHGSSCCCGGINCTCAAPGACGGAN